MVKKIEPPKDSKLERNNELEAKVQNYIKSTTDLPIHVFSAFGSSGSTLSAQAEQAINEGTTPAELASESFIDDRSVKIQIDRDDNGAEWCFENDVAVYNNLMRLDNLLNNGFEAVITDRKFENDAKAKEARDFLNLKIMQLELQKRTSNLVINRGLYGWAVLKKRTKADNDVIGLVPLDCNGDRAKPVVDSLTGELGGDRGKGLNPHDLDMEVALIQKGKLATYNSEGDVNYIDWNFYFKNEELVVLSNDDRGRFKGTAPVRRVIRLVEIKKTLENVVEMIVRRYGPQIWIMVGNDKYNLSNTRIPESYMRGSDGNPKDLEDARADYKNAIFDNIEKGIQKWVEGESIIQIAEWGIEPIMKAPQTNLFQYSRYIDLFADYIKVGIFGLDIAGRVDVTSAIMQDRLFRDIKDRARRERANIENLYHRALTIPLLKFKQFSDEIINVVRIQFKTLDKTDVKEDADMERFRSMTVKNYLDAKVEVPQYLQEKWGLKLKPIKAPEGESTEGNSNDPPQTSSEEEENQETTPPTPRGGRKR